MSALACPLCGQEVMATRQGMASHARADGRPCAPEGGPGIGAGALGCSTALVGTVAAIALTSWAVLWVSLLAALAAVVWKAGFSAGARVEAADLRAMRAVEEAASSTSGGVPVRDLAREAKRLLEELPPLGAAIEESIAACMTRLRPLDPQPLEVRFTKLARAHVAADEWILGLAVGTPETLSGKGPRPLAIITDRALVVKDRDVAYRDTDPQVEPGEHGFVISGTRTFHVTSNHGLEVTLAARELAASSRRTAVVPSGRPPERLIREARDAELIAAEWMRYLGFADATATPVGADGGIDVVSEEAVAQVKLEGKATGRPTVQQLHGVAVNEGKTGVFFSAAGYTPQARTWAETSGTALFRFDRQGAVEAVNTVAHQMLAAADSR
ncbi:restriction endonuclease [Streptomyces sp. NPDC002643]